MATDIPDPEKWVELYGDALFRFAMARVRHQERAEDLVQEALLAGLRSRATFDGRSGLLTWLTSILKHKIQDFYRTKWRETPATDLESPDGEDGFVSQLFDQKGEWQQNAPRAWGRPGVALESDEFMAVLADCLEKLPRRIADVFTMREIDGEDSEQVCKAMGITATNFWAMMHRARTRLRHCLEINWFGKPEGPAEL